jgi:hypothetical protein
LKLEVEEQAELQEKRQFQLSKAKKKLQVVHFWQQMEQPSMKLEDPEKEEEKSVQMLGELEEKTKQLLREQNVQESEKRV